MTEKILQVRVENMGLGTEREDIQIVNIQETKTFGAMKIEGGS